MGFVSPGMMFIRPVLANHFCREKAAKYHAAIFSVLVFLLVPVMAIFSSTTSHALGLGTLTLNSHLNQKLNATVPVLLSSSESMHKVRVELASPSEYRQMGLPWKGFLKMVRIEIHGRNSSTPYVKLTTPLAMNAPLLPVVLKTTKEGRGTYFRHYQIFLDPVEMAAIYSNGEPQVVPVKPLSSTDVGRGEIESDGWSRIWRYGPVKAGDSLSEVAYRLRRDKRYSNRQVMLALFEQNPDSFTDGNINHLKKGAWLNVPKGTVVKSYGTPSAMQRLGKLLSRSIHTVADAGNASTPVVKPVQAETLQYSRKISIAKASGAVDTGVTEGVNREAFEKLDSIHEEMMSGKLQMTDLGKTVANLDRSVTAVQEEMKSLKADVNMLKAKAAVPPSQSFNYWMAAFFVVLTALIAMLVSLYNRRRIQKEWDQKRVSDGKKSKAASTTAEVVKAKVVEQPESGIAPLANKIEESLSRCDFDKAEQLLEAAEKKEPDSLRLAALKAQLYHETERDELRNELINSVSESADKKRWEEFCKILPTHVWNACFGDGSADGGQ